ncbi:hypothetical protein JW824_06720 [bacterium]|nr:hypothetical protein [bacterium]
MGKNRYKGKQNKESRTLYLKSGNYLLFGLGLVLIIIGFVVLSKGPWNGFSSLTLAPILLVIGYLVIVPFAILYKTKNNRKETELQ